MAEADWTALTAALHHGLDSGDVSKGVSNAFTPPTGGGTFVQGFHTLLAVSGVSGYYYSGTAGFNPIVGNKGGSIRGALRKYSSGSPLYAPVLAMLSNGTDLQTASGYYLGLSTEDPYHIVLKKGLLTTGLDSDDDGVLRYSDEAFTSHTTWFHLRLDVLVNPQLDVVLNVYRNLGNVTTPTWVAIPGMDSYVDDSLGVLSGSVPLVLDFRGVIGHYAGGVAGTVSLIDHIELSRQLAP